MNLNYFLCETVKVIKTGRQGVVVDVDNTHYKLLIEFPEGKREWYYEDDVVPVRNFLEG